jgi:2-dehydro-3-deoxy-D-arabinonate dehydratase
MAPGDRSMLTRHLTAHGARWARGGYLLSEHFHLGLLLETPHAFFEAFLAGVETEEEAVGPLLPPIEPSQEVWAAGVTYLRSREARTAESQVKDVYEKVYDAERPELFFKAIGARVVGHGMKIRVRADSRWNVPEPELCLVLNRELSIVGYSAGNDVSSRDIEGENPLYLPQAKVYDGSCALGPCIRLAVPDQLRDLPIVLEVRRGSRLVFKGETRSSSMKRSLEDLAGYLGRELSFPGGAFLLTGTGIVPPEDFNLSPGDRVSIDVGGLKLENDVAANQEGRE